MRNVFAVRSEATGGGVGIPIAGTVPPTPSIGESVTTGECVTDMVTYVRKDWREGCSKKVCPQLAVSWCCKVNFGCARRVVEKNRLSSVGL